MISVIIPTFNEQDNIGPLVRYLREVGEPALLREILVVDGGSTDQTRQEATAAGAILLLSPTKGRAAQMNVGAAHAQGHILYFLHADTYPPQHFCRDITEACRRGSRCGAYRLQFDHRHWFLRVNAWFTRFNSSLFRFGDQSLFAEKALFYEIGGFREDLVVMEDQEIIFRLRRRSRFEVLAGSVTTSARKYRENGVFRTQFLFYLIYGLYQVGVSQARLVALYRRWLKQDKV